MSQSLAPDWILQQTLDVQRQAHTAWSSTKPELDDGGLTLTVVGCGTMGVSILGGIMDSLSKSSQDNNQECLVPTRLPTKFKACVRRPESARRVKAELGKYNARLTTHESDNLGAVRDADVVLLSCEPDLVGDILSANGIKDALAGKLLISICAGISVPQIHDIMYATPQTTEKKCTIVRAMPNPAASIRESMTVIARSTPPLPAETQNLVTWIFTRVGKVKYLLPSLMDVSTALCGSGTAFTALIAESLAAGAITMGLPREEAYSLAAQTMRGATGLLLEGEHPAILRDRATTPGGCTMAGLAVLEEGGLRGTVARAVRQATSAASQLGQPK